ncbi:MAG: AAA family ATPase [Armatimonadota bacterium]|nr:AAA family ATPase [Armatimonadota bacterium]
MRRWYRRAGRWLWGGIALAVLWHLWATNEFARQTVLMYAFYAAFIVFWTGGQIFGFVYFMARPRREVFLPGQAGLPTLERDYWGQPRLVELARQWVTVIRGHREFRAMGGIPPRGWLLYGPPGSGKTWLARCIAGSAQIPFIYLDASSLSSAWFGIGNLNVILTFRLAKKLAMAYGSCALYLDEIDAIGAARAVPSDGRRTSMRAMLVGGMGGGGSMLLSTLLHELDGSADTFFVERWCRRVCGWLGIPLPPPDWHVVVFGSTNIPGVLDPALLRAGRLSRQIKVDLPDRAGRREIVAGYLRRIRAAPDVDVDTLVDELSDVSPADIKVLVTEEAPRVAVFEGADCVHMRHLLQALHEVQVGLRNPISEVDPLERERIAVHEAGHAVLQWVLTDHRISSVTVVRYGDALGHTLSKETRQRVVRSLNELWVDTVISAGGRAAEIMVYGEPLRSVGGDYPAMMDRCRELLDWGLWGSPAWTAAQRAQLTRYLFDEALSQAGRLLQRYKALHWALVQRLVVDDEVTHDELVQLWGDRPREALPNPQRPKRVDGPTHHEEEGEDNT